MAAALGAGVLALIISVAVVLAGAPLLGQWSGRTQIATIQQGALQRSYRVFRPPHVSRRPGLVLDLHSAHTNGFLEELATRLDAQAPARDWLVAYPDGIADGWEPYGCCRHDGVDDLAFLGSLIDRLEQSDGVDPDRVYVTGLSRGGMMAYRVGCELSSRLAAIAPVAGNMADDQGSVGAVPCHPDRPLSVLAIHGSADREVPIAGGDRFAPFTDVISRWRQLDGCQASAAVVVAGRVTRSD